ncbi:MAG: hypothetical protein JWM96_1064 [Alphaproteobacteria bacterium]|nr:hypothetical protein [Alphaproteobacteria bacterium]
MKKSFATFALLNMLALPVAAFAQGLGESSISDARAMLGVDVDTGFDFPTEGARSPSRSIRSPSPAPASDRIAAPNSRTLSDARAMVGVDRGVSRSRGVSSLKNAITPGTGSALGTTGAVTRNLGKTLNVGTILGGGNNGRNAAAGGGAKARPGLLNQLGGR